MGKRQLGKIASVVAALAYAPSGAFGALIDSREGVTNNLLSFYPGNVFKLRCWSRSMQKLCARFAFAIVGLSALAGAGSANAMPITQTFNFLSMADEFWNNSGSLNTGNPGQSFDAIWDQGVSYHETLGLGATDGFWDGSINGAGGSGGIVEIRAYSAGGTTVAPTPAGTDHAFLAGSAGLGVCSTGIYSESGFDLSRCSSNFTNAGGTGTFNTSDASVFTPEILALEFSKDVVLELGLVADNFSGVIQLSQDMGSNWLDVTVSNGTFPIGSLSGDSFWFRPTGGAAFLSGVTATVGQVPAPGTLLLILAGLGGTALTRTSSSRREVT